MNYIATLTRGTQFSDVTVPFNDKPHVGEKIYYRGLEFTVKSWRDTREPAEDTSSNDDSRPAEHRLDGCTCDALNGSHRRSCIWSS
jgi:hypothetical protein